MRLKKDWRIVYKIINSSDIILEVLDARFPQKTRCIHLEELVNEKEKKILILCLNKADLIPTPVANKWKRTLAKEHPTVYISARDRLGTKILRDILKKASRGESCIVAAVGFPNTGKSSIINVLKGRHSAPTAATPGWTKHGQLYRITETLAFYDSPGVLPFEGSIEDQVVYGGYPIEKLDDPLRIALKLLEKLQTEHPKSLQARYNTSASGELFLADLARMRGRLLPGGIPNIEQAARELLRDFVDGKIVYWENP